jgi:hypothetical protein
MDKLEPDIFIRFSQPFICSVLLFSLVGLELGFMGEGDNIYVLKGRKPKYGGSVFS